MSFTIQIDHELTDKFLSGIIEESTMAIGYWASVMSIARDDDGYVTQMHLMEFDEDTGRHTESFFVDCKAIANAIADHDVAKGKLGKALQTAILENANGIEDAYDDEQLVQLACFGEIKYG